LKKRSSLLVSLLILALFAYFLYEYKVFYHMGEILKSLNPFYLAVSLILYLATYYFRAKRFTVMFPQISTLELSAVMAVHTFFNNLLPFRSGEASFPIILKKLFKVEISISSGALLFARLLDLLSLSFLFSLSVLVVAFGKRELLFLSVLLTFLLIGLLFIGFKLIKALKEKVALLSTLFLFFSQFVSPRKLTLIGIYSLGTWLFKFASFFFILKGAQVNLNFFQTVFVSTFGELTTVLPIHSIGGFGTYEAGLVGGFKLLGLKASYSLTVAFYFHLVLLLMSGLLAVLGWGYLWFKVKKKLG